MDDGDAEIDATFIWGTNLSVSRVQSRFDAFVRTFRLPDEPYPKYQQLLQEVRVPLCVVRVKKHGHNFLMREVGLEIRLHSQPRPCPTCQTRDRGDVSFNIDGHHLYDFDRTLYNWAVTYPAETGARR